jgi:hypothetical protein
MLCVPIFNGQKDVIGVAQLINKARTRKKVCASSGQLVELKAAERGDRE